MRPLMFVILLAGTGYAQSMVENAAAAAGGSAGGIAGRTVGKGIANIFGKVDQTTTKAAKTAAPHAKTNDDADVPLMEVGPGVPKGPSVPPPPPIRRLAHRVARYDVPEPPAPAARAVPVRVAAPVPQMTVGELKNIALGTARAQLLQRGQPAVRISEVGDDGHFVEIYRYMAKDTTIGMVRLIDGSVASVLLQ
jgi:hypothetical protein